MRHLEVIYCDDVRQEVGNKQSLIGVYPGDLNIEAMPAVLPKLCVVATLAMSTVDSFESLRIKVMQGEQCLFESGEIPLPEEDVLGNAGEADKGLDEEPWTRISVVVVLSPFQVDEETSLRVVAEVDGLALFSRSLRIRCGMIRVRHDQNFKNLIHD